MTYKMKENVSLAIKILVGIVYCMPVFMAILFAFHTNDEILTIPLKFFTASPTLENFRYVFKTYRFLPI